MADSIAVNSAYSPSHIIEPVNNDNLSWVAWLFSRRNADNDQHRKVAVGGALVRPRRMNDKIPKEHHVPIGVYQDRLLSSSGDGKEEEGRRRLRKRSQMMDDGLELSHGGSHTQRGNESAPSWFFSGTTPIWRLIYHINISNRAPCLSTSMNELKRNNSICVSIVGTAGRKEDAVKMTAKVFAAMCAITPTLITSFDLISTDVGLVSGGAGSYLITSSPHHQLDCEVDFCLVFCCSRCRSRCGAA